MRFVVASSIAGALGVIASCASPPRAAKCPNEIRTASSATAAAPDRSPERFVSAGDFSIAVRARAVANLTYQLDCLAAVAHCSEAAIRSLWEPGWTKDDDAALDRWRKVRKAYDVSAPFVTNAPETPMPLPYDSLEFDKRVRIAGLVSSTARDYETSLAVLLPPQDAATLVRAVLHFLPRFDAWWSASGKAIAERFKVGTEQLFEHGELSAIITRAARFYATPLPRGTVVDFDIVVLPGPSKSTSGEQMLSHGVIEVTPNDTPARRMDVVCHELFHFFYNARTPTQQAELAARFGSSADALAGIAYFLIDESIATALGNGVVARAVSPADYARRKAREMGFYANHAIDATAKGILARTNDDPTAGALLDSPEMAQTILGAVRDAVSDDPRPIEYLHSFAGASEPGVWDSAMKSVSLKASANNVYNQSPIDGNDAVQMIVKHPSLSAVIVVPRARLLALSAYGEVIPHDARAAIEREANRDARKGPFAFGLARSPHAELVVIVAEDGAAASHVAEALFAREKRVRGVFRAEP